MSEEFQEYTDDAETPAFQEELSEVHPSAEHLELEDIHTIRLPVTADLGRCHITVRDIMDMEIGTVLSLDKLAGEMADIYVNSIPLARGEVVVLGDTLHVRIAEILGISEMDMYYE